MFLRALASYIAWPSMRMLPLARLLQAGDGAQGRGLAAARGPEQGHVLAAATVKLTPFTATASP